MKEFTPVYEVVIYRPAKSKFEYHHPFFEVTLKAQDQLQKISGLRQPAVNERIPSLLSMQFPWLLLQSLQLLLPDVT
jgi:hypothetical protein